MELADLIKQLREDTSAGFSDCKKALESCQGDIKKAKEFLRKKGLEVVAKKSNKEASDGRIEAYIHLGNKIGVLVEVNSQTDFVARNEEFCKFSRDVAMQIAATNPKYISDIDIPGDKLSELSGQDKELFIKENCLLRQPFIKDPSLTIEDYRNSLIAKFGENIIIKRFTRFKLGE
ncbi:MAG: translation elongation factor Ts [Candidatus Omnitrophota bacterium]